MFMRFATVFSMLLASGAPTAVAAEATREVRLHGTADWHCDGIHVMAVTWHLRLDHTFMDTYTDTGRWWVSDGRLHLQYTSSGTVYAANRMENGLEGEFWSGEDSGCWEAARD